jgi:hypothetical protein
MRLSCESPFQRTPEGDQTFLTFKCVAARLAYTTGLSGSRERHAVYRSNAPAQSLRENAELPFDFSSSTRAALHDVRCIRSQ